MLTSFLVYWVFSNPIPISTTISSEEFVFHFITVGKDSVYALDGKEGVVSEFTHSGATKRQFGQGGPGPGELQDPRSLIETKPGELWISHTSGRSIAVFKDGKYIRDFQTKDLFDLVRVKDRLISIPSSSKSPFKVLDLSGKEVSSFILPEHSLPLPDKAGVEKLWYQATVSSYKEGLALSWHWLPALGSVALDGSQFHIWEHELYPASKTMNIGRGEIPLDFTGRTIAESPKGHLIVGACKGKECQEILVVDIHNHRLLRKIPFPRGAIQICHQNGILAILTQDRTIEIIEPGQIDLVLN